MLIILDRDGVINEDRDDYVKTLDEFKFIPGSIEAIAKLKHAGHQVAIATNQSGIGRGYYSEKTLLDMHEKIKRELKKYHAEIDLIEYCPHTPEDNCECRKPKPGMLINIGKKLHADLTKAIFIGDAVRDIEAAIAVGAQPILVETGNGKEHRKIYPSLAGIPTYENLAAAVNAIIKKPSH